MSDRPLLGSGEIQSDEVTRLKREISGLESELDEAREALKDEKLSSVHAKRALKRFQAQFKPMYDSLRGLFEDLPEDVDVESIARPTTFSSGIWQDRISKMEGGKARILTVMLDGGGPMSLQQIRQAAQTHGNTSTYLGHLVAKNWVQKSGHGMYSLKQ